MILKCKVAKPKATVKSILSYCPIVEHSVDENSNWSDFFSPSKCIVRTVVYKVSCDVMYNSLVLNVCF